MSFITGPNLVRDGLILYWDSSNTKSYPSSGSTWSELTDITYRGTLINSPVFASGAKGSFNFDGVNYYVETNYTTPIGTNNLTVGIWFKYSISQLGGLFSKRRGASSYEQLSIVIAGDINANTQGTKIVVIDFNNPASRNMMTTGSYNDGLWHYLTLIRGTSDSKLYVDGSLANTVISTTPNLSNSTKLFIGAVGEEQNVLGSYFSGSIANVQVYNRALSLEEMNQNWNAMKLRFGRSVGSPPGLDGDAQAFLSITGITDPTITSAINTLVANLKFYGLWTKMKAIYPFVGGTANTHKFNLKDPRDLNAAFRLTFAGTWTHNGSGGTPDGSSGFANTNILGNTDIAKENAGMGVYTTTESLTNGTWGLGGNFHISVRWTNGLTYWRICTDFAAGFATNVGSSRGLFHGYSNSPNTSTAYYNGNLQSTFAGTFAIASSNLLLAYAGSGYSPDSRTIAFAFVSLGLNNTEATNLYNSIQAFQTTLGRQV